MKTFVKTFAFLVMVIAGTWLVPQQASAQNGNVSLQVFYDELSPYGTWIEDQQYGYVWAPDVDEDFSPYVTNGHWVLSDYGWTWVSDFEWGWAPFHYGRWTFDENYGNVWIPDTVWGPAWVTWRQANGYYGWSPMGPGIDINMSFGNSYNVPYNRWVFVSNRDFMQNDLNNYCLDRSMNSRIYGSSFVIRNTRFDNNRHSTYVFGPRREDVQRYSGRSINEVHIRDYNKPGQSYERGNLSMYRPQIQRNNANGRMPAPNNINSDRNSQSGQQRNASPSRNQRDQQAARNENSFTPGRSTQSSQQPNVNPSRNQREQQPSRSGNTYNSQRYTQPTQQPNVNTERNQRADQPSRNGNSYNTQRYSQPAQQPVQQPTQQPTARPERNQREEQPSRNQNSYNTQRSAQPERQPAANQQRNQRESRQEQNSQPAASPRQQQPTMVVNPERNNRGESKGKSDENRPRR